MAEANFLGVVWGSRAAVDTMRAHGGHIVNMASMSSFGPVPGLALYGATKHAVLGFTDALRSELMHEGSNVRVTSVHLPGLNTPQFEQVKTTLRGHPRPVPPVYQPEVAADAVVWAAHHYRREWTVGLITDVVLAGNAVLPGFGDWYLGKTGYDSQMTDEPEDPNRPNNLYRPLPGDWGAHGRFDAKAYDTSEQWWVTKNRLLLAVAGAAGLGLLAGLASDRNGRG
jgi:hypothetical protein